MGSYGIVTSITLAKVNYIQCMTLLTRGVVSHVFTTTGKNL